MRCSRVCFGCLLDASLEKCSRHVLLGADSEEDSGSQLAWEHLEVLLDELQEVTWATEVCVCLCWGCYPNDPIPEEEVEDG